MEKENEWYQQIRNNSSVTKMVTNYRCQSGTSRMVVTPKRVSNCKSKNLSPKSRRLETITVHWDNEWVLEWLSTLSVIVDMLVRDADSQTDEYPRLVHQIEAMNRYPLHFPPRPCYLRSPIKYMRTLQKGSICLFSIEEGKYQPLNYIVWFRDYD